MTKYCLIFWIVIAYGLCLMPGPGYWSVRLEERWQSVHEPSFIAQKKAGSLSTKTDVAAGQKAADSQRLDAEQLPGDETPSNKIETGYAWPKTEQRLHIFLTENLKTKERLGHVLPMLGVGFCLVHLVRKKYPRRSFWVVVLVVCFTGTMALSIELLQETLPEWFHRGFALDDIGFSMLGGLLGSLGGFLFLTAKERIDRERSLPPAALEGLRFRLVERYSSERGTSEGK